MKSRSTGFSNPFEQSALKPSCEHFCEDCGDCLECYSEDVCAVSKRTHSEVQIEENPELDRLKNKMIGATLTGIIQDEQLGNFRLKFTRAGESEIDVLVTTFCGDVVFELVD